jgi:hypothetical protein
MSNPGTTADFIFDGELVKLGGIRMEILAYKFKLQKQGIPS